MKQILKTSSLLTAAFVCLVLLSTQADASIQAGDYVRFSSGAGRANGGGAFGVFEVTGTSPGAPGSKGIKGDFEFWTFCLERNEYLDFSNDFKVDSISQNAMGGGKGGGGINGDPLGERTAWLYYNFRLGTLQNDGAVSGWSTGRLANTIQNAIWDYEEEQLPLTNDGLILQGLAESADLDRSSSNMLAAIGSVRVMNISYATGSSYGNRAQSQLFLVPEPASMATWSLLALGFAGFSRRRRSQKK